MLAEIVNERLMEGDTELVARSVRVTDWVAGRVPEIEPDPVTEGVNDSLDEELEVWVGEIEEEEEPVAVTESDGLGVEEIGGDGDIIPTLPNK